MNDCPTNTVEHTTSAVIWLGENRCRFRIWAPYAKRVHVHLFTPHDRVLRLPAVDDGYFEKVIEGVPAGASYKYRLDNDRERPDPASRLQSEGVHGRSEVVDPYFDWGNDDWHGRPLSQYIVYELHVGTFTSQGTFDGVIERLDHLVDLGVTAIELMPVAACPGQRNWGYDGVYPFAVQANYGGPAGLKRLVRACHRRGLSVVLDVVYNHLGPEGNYLADFGPYFTRKYGTPWGQAINFDDTGSREVRRFFLANALRWISEFRIDALRLDAVHAIYDASAEHFLKELSLAMHARVAHDDPQAIGRRGFTIAESNFNIPRLTMTRDEGGDGLDGQWNDDFHYAVHARLTNERMGHYRDFGGADQVTKAVSEGFVLTGQFSHYRGRTHGESSHRTPAERLTICLQNHDQTGNRPQGERLGHLVDAESLKVAVALLLLSPYVPLLFMGEEYNEPAPFLYFTDHGDSDLNDRVRRGRRADFHRIGWRDTGFDPSDTATFERSRLDIDLKLQDRHAQIFRLYQALIRLRKESPALQMLSKSQMQITPFANHKLLVMRRWTVTRYDTEVSANNAKSITSDHVVAVFNLSNQPHEASMVLPPGRWKHRLDTTSRDFGGSRTLSIGDFMCEGNWTITMPPLAAALWQLAT